MCRRSAILLLLVLLSAPPALAKKARRRAQEKGGRPAVTTIVLDPSDGPEELKEALKEAKAKGAVRIVVASPEGTSTPLATAKGAYRPADVQVNDPSYDGFPGYFHAEPSVAAQGDAVACVYNDSGNDPTSPNPSPVGTNTDGFATSSDRGASWRDQGKRAPAGAFTAFNGDNVVAAGPDGDFYYLSDGGKGGQSWNAMACSRSTDGGRTWNAPTSPSLGVTSRLGGFFDKGWIAVDRSSTPTRGNVYVTWSDFGGNATDLYVARSTDHGATWSAQILDQFPHPVAVTYVQVAPNGLVYVGEQDEGTLAGGGMTGTNYVRVSTDGGRTYSTLRSAGAYRSVGDPVANALCGDPNFFGGLVRYLNGPIESDSSLRIAVDPSDASGQTVFVATQAIPQTPGDGSDVFLWRSTDGGLTWAEPVRVNDDTTKTDQFMPDLWVAPDGTVGVLWLDRRNDPKANWRLEAWMALSKDHGRTFGCSFPVSSRAFPPVGRCQMSDYNGVFADERGFVLAWGDSRQIDPQKQLTFAIYGATVSSDGPGPILSVDRVRIDPRDPSRFLVRLRNDGTADATGLSVTLSIDGNMVMTVAPVIPVRFPDVPACHGTAEAIVAIPWATATPDVHGTVDVQGPLGTSSLPFSAPRGGPRGVLLSANFDAGLGDFTAQPGSLWHATSQCSGGRSVAFFGNDASCGYGSGTRLYGALTSKTVALPTGGATLRFREAAGLSPRWGSDRMLVQISTDGGASFENLWGYGYMSRYVLDPATPIADASGNPAWHDVALDVSDYAGHDVVIRFFAYVGARSGRGWAIDDVTLTSTSAVAGGALGTCAAPQDVNAAMADLAGLAFDLSASVATAQDPAPSCGDGSVHHPFWLTYTPPVDGTVRFLPCGNAGGGAIFSAWSGACGSLTPLGCTAIDPCAMPPGVPPKFLDVEGHAGVPIRLLFSSTTETSAQVQIYPNPLAAGSLVPIVLDIPPGRAHYTTELSLANHDLQGTNVAITYAASLGSGSGTITKTLAPGVLAIPDVIAWLRENGLAIPATGSQAGTLRIVASPRVHAVARTLAATAPPQPAGAASLAYPAVPLSSPSRVTVFGLRSTSADRSKVAVFNPSLEPVTFRVRVVSGAGDGRGVVYREADTLPAGGWVQYDGILEETGVANGWAVVERTSASGAASAYGVVNDNATNDGSYLPPLGTAGASASLTVPVLVETPRFATELVLANQGSTDAALTLSYRESLDGAGGAASVALVLPARTQRIVADAFALLRAGGATIGPKGRSYAGALRVEVSGVAAGDVWAAARVSAPSPAGGAFGLFVPGLYRGEELSEFVRVDGLRADAANRSNVAVVNTGADGAGPLTLRLQAYDGATGAPAGAPLDVTLPPGGWAQPPDFFASAHAATGWVLVTRQAGSAPFTAYGVVNDGARPGERTDDGAYVNPAQ